MNTNDKSIEKIFKNIGDLRSFDLLLSKIFNRIDQEEEKKTQIRVIITRIVGGLSFVALFPIFFNVFSQLQNSSFWNYLSLMFTDTSTVFVYWKEFLLSLIEAFPVFQISLILFLTFLLFVSLRFSTKDFKKIGLSANLA